MVTAYAIRPASGGFGEFERACEGIKIEHCESIEEYCEWVARENKLVSGYAIDPDEADMGDEDGERLAAAIRERQGRTRGQDGGTIVAFMVAGEVQCEVVAR